MSEQLQSEPAAARTDGLADEVLQIVHELVLELYPHREGRLQVELESSLDRDLGLDSLGRAELVLRLDRAFSVTLPDSLLAEAECPRDLVDAVRETGVDHRRLGRIERVPPASAWAAVPTSAETLNEVLDWHAAQQPDRPHIILSAGAGEESTISFAALHQEALATAQALVRWGLVPGERAAIMLPTDRAFFRTFYGILYAGGVPVPIYPPMRMSGIEDHLRRQAGILNNCEAAILITVPEARTVAALMRTQVPSLRAVETPGRLTDGPAELPPPPAATDLALLQYTSGSTGDPKGVMLSHANLLDNIRAMGLVMGVEPDDVFISWLPLYHDMGLIGAWLGTLYFAVPVVIMSPLTFLVRPHEWLWAIHRHRGTLSGGPNFGFELCLRRVRDEDIEGLDLSSLRMVVNGAEAVSPSTIRGFTERFAPYGFRAEALAPVFRAGRERGRPGFSAARPHADRRPHQP